MVYCTSCIMSSPARRLLIGVCLVAQRSVSYHIPRAVPASPFSYARATSRSMGIFTQSRRHGLHSSRVVMQAATMQETIESRLMEALSPVHLEVINESHMHSGPATESHFKVRVRRSLCDHGAMRRLLIGCAQIFVSNRSYRQPHSVDSPLQTTR